MPNTYSVSLVIVQFHLHAAKSKIIADSPSLDEELPLEQYYLSGIYKLNSKASETTKFGASLVALCINQAILPLLSFHSLLLKRHHGLVHLAYSRLRDNAVRRKEFPKLLKFCPQTPYSAISASVSGTSCSFIGDFLLVGLPFLGRSDSLQGLYNTKTLAFITEE